MSARVAGAAALATAAVLVAGTGVARAGTVLPERGGSPNADRIASLYTAVLIPAAIVFVLVTCLLAFALWRYNAKRHPIASQIRGHTRLEIGWTTAASVLILALAVIAFTRLGGIQHPDRAVASPALAAAGVDDGEMRIRVVGRQYLWRFEYPNGAYSYAEMVAPVGATVTLDIVSEDVAHSWWIPKLGGKTDAIPGYVAHTWFRLEHTGVFRGQCAELCGRNHADMIARVRAVTPAAYARWVTQRKQAITAAKQALSEQRRSPTLR